jgi:hypothetical protein
MIDQKAFLDRLKSLHPRGTSGRSESLCVEPHTLIVHQPPGGYLLDNRQVQMTCAKSAGICLGYEIKFKVAR